MHPKITSVLRSKWTIPVAVGTVSFGVGVVAGWFAAKKKLEETVEITVEEDYQLTLVFDEPEHVDIPRPVFVINEEDFYVEPDEPSMVNVFAETDDDWDYELELQNRLPHIPYVIHQDEYFGDEMGWDSQSTLTWYEGDGVLLDSMDNVLLNAPTYIGNPTFGHGSRDPNVVYVRNERLHSEYEIVRDPGSYEIDVLGGQIESQMEREDFRHSRSPGKFPRE